MDRYGIGPQRLGLIAAPGGIHEHPSLDPNSLLAAEITGIFDAGDEREPVIQHAVWVYLRFTLSYRDVEELLAERGLDISSDSRRRCHVGEL